MLPKNNGIYSLAKKAKERLKRNNYSVSTTTRTIDNSQIITSYINSHKKKEKSPKQITLPSEASEEFYRKVCELIERGNIANPVSELIDKEVFSLMCVEEKQYYIASLNQKYKKSRDRYYREHTITLSL